MLHAPPTDGIRVATRILGARYIVEGLGLLARPTVGARRTVRTIDLLHGASMVALALGCPGLRRAAITSVGISAAMAASVSGGPGSGDCGDG